MTKEEGLTPAQVYNADETAVIKLLPSKTLAAKYEKEARGYKKQKERVTIMACCNVDGSHKPPLMLIGKSQKPRCFTPAEMSTLPVEYRAQKKAWMNSDFFLGGSTIHLYQL